MAKAPPRNHSTTSRNRSPTTTPTATYSIDLEGRGLNPL